MCLDSSLTPPLCGGASPSVASPHLVVGFPVHWYVSGYLYVMWGFFPSVRGLGLFSHQLGVLGGTSALILSICSFLYIFIVHYVSHFYYYVYNYYLSSYSCIFWPVIILISDSGSLPHRVSSKLGSVWSGSTTTFDAERL